MRRSYEQTTQHVAGNIRSPPHRRNDPPKAALSKRANSLKGVSSRIFRSEYTGQINQAIKHGRFWPRSYFAESCGAAPTTVVRQDIDQQKRPS